MTLNYNTIDTYDSSEMESYMSEVAMKSKSKNIADDEQSRKSRVQPQSIAS